MVSHATLAPGAAPDQRPPDVRAIDPPGGVVPDTEVEQERPRPHGSAAFHQPHLDCPKTQTQTACTAALDAPAPDVQTRRMRTLRGHPHVLTARYLTQNSPVKSTFG